MSGVADTIWIGGGPWEDIVLGTHETLRLKGRVVVQRNEVEEPDKEFEEIEESPLSFPQEYEGRWSFKSWRAKWLKSSCIHIHEFDEHYVFHQDDHYPDTLAAAIRHLIDDTTTGQKVAIGAGLGVCGWLAYKALRSGK